MLGLRNPRKKEKAKSSGEDSRVIGSFLEALEATHDSPIPVQQSNTQCFWAVVYLCYDRRNWWINSQLACFESRVGVEVRIFGFYNKKPEDKKTVRWTNSDECASRPMTICWRRDGLKILGFPVMLGPEFLVKNALDIFDGEHSFQIKWRLTWSMTQRT